MKLTAALLKGKAYVDLVKLEHDGKEYEIEVRPLTHTEKAEVDAIQQKSINIDPTNMRRAGQSVKVNAGEVSKDKATSELKMIELATIDPEWTTETINQTWKPEWITKVVDHISEISGIDRGQNKNSFRENE